MIYKLFVSKLLFTQSTDNHHRDASIIICVQLFRKHERRSGGFSDAHMSSSDEILAPFMAGKDVAVRRLKRRTTLRTGSRRVLVVKDTLPNVLPHARRSGFAGGMNAIQQTQRTPAANTTINSPKPLRTEEASTAKILNQFWIAKFAVDFTWARSAGKLAHAHISWPLFFGKSTFVATTVPATARCAFDHSTINSLPNPPRPSIRHKKCFFAQPRAGSQE